MSGYKIYLFFLKKNSAKAVILRDCSIRDFPYLKNWFYDKKLWIYIYINKSEKIQHHLICKYWKETKPKVFLRYFLLGIEITSSYMYHEFLGILNILK